MVFHGRGFGLRIGQHAARWVNDGGSGARCLPFLGCDIGQRMLPVVLHAMGEHQGFLLEIALDLIAQGALPCGTDGHLDRDGSGADHEQEDQHQLEEYPPSQRPTSKR